MVMIQPMTPARRRELAHIHGLNEQYLYQLLTGKRDMKPIEAMRLETDSGGELTRQMLCQSTFSAVWPELAEPMKEAETAAKASA